MTTTNLPPPAPPVRPPATWSAGIWVVVTLAAVIEGVVALVALFLINWGASAGCRTEATMSDVREGEFGLLAATCVGLLPWAMALAISPRRRGLIAVAALAVSPLLYGIVAGLDPEFWTNGFCF